MSSPQSEGVIDTPAAFDIDTAELPLFHPDEYA